MAPVRRARVSPGFWRGKRVFLTGHTGFKGGWLAFWLARMGADVTGFALPPATTPALFDVLGLAEDLTHIPGDIRDAAALAKAVRTAAPDVVLHLAAQPIVSEGYADPVATFETNVMGVVHLLEACRSLQAAAQVLIVSSDKCYRNDGSGRAFAVNDPLGGEDPYSASKAGTEIVAQSYAASFFGAASPVRIATARAGNVIGGGDWATNRLIPDGARAFSAQVPLVLRNPLATRPWQHVLEPLHGYLALVEAMATEPRLAGAWNFGPALNAHESVGHVADLMARAWGEGARVEITSDRQDWHEAKTLDIDTTVTAAQLGWTGVLPLDTAVGWSAEWYRQQATAPGRAALRALTQRQIESYVALQDTHS